MDQKRLFRHPFSRRAIISAACLAVFDDFAAAAAQSNSPLLTPTLALVTSDDLLTLAPALMLQRLTFRGGTPVKDARADGVVYDLRDGPFTYAHVELARQGDGWRLGTLSVLFTPDDGLPLAAFDRALTPKFGKPVDRTTGNTVQVWTAPDRSIRVTADPPGDAAMLVYAVTVTR